MSQGGSVHFGLLISALLHVAILGGALLSIYSRPELRVPEPEPVAVGMISPDEVTKVRQGMKTAKLLAAVTKESPKGDLAKKEAARPKPAAAAPPPPPPSAPPPPAAAEKKLEAERLAEQQRLAEKKRRAEEQANAEAMKRAEEQKLAEERKRAEDEQKRLEERHRQAELQKKRDEERKRRQAALKKTRDEAKRREAAAAKKKFDADKISALLNKVPDKAAPPPPAAAPDQLSKTKGPTLGAPDGRDRQISASERAMIGQIIKSCVVPNWTVLSGGASAQDTVVKIRLRFNEDGTLSAPPVVTNPQETPYFRAISESALRAVQQCEPYNLPPSKYQLWKDVIMNFSPKDMF